MLCGHHPRKEAPFPNERPYAAYLRAGAGGGPSRFLQEIPGELLESRLPKESSSSQWGTRASWESERAKGFPSWKGKAAKTTGTTYEYFESDHVPSYQVKSAESGGGKQINVGQRVRHSSYGLGMVKALEGSESDRKVTIDFSGQVKKFSLRHVELEVV